MQQVKSESEILAEIYRNAQLALYSISDILPETEEGGLKDEILREHEEYERICSEAAGLARKYALELKDPSPVKKAMMWSAIKMNAATDNSDANIAAMMIKGTVTGITSLKTSLSEGRFTDEGGVKELLNEFIGMEEGFEKKLKKYL